MTNTDKLFNGPAQRVLELAVKERDLMGHQYVGPEHLLLAIIREPDNIGAEALALSAGTDLPTIRGRVLELRKAKEKKAAPPPEPDLIADLIALLPTIKRFGTIILEDLASHFRTR